MTVLWRPSAARVAQVRLTTFLRGQGQLGADGQVDYARAHAWSLADPEGFWSAVWQFGPVMGEAGDTVFVPGEAMWAAKYFPQAQLNFAENLLQRTGPGEALVSLDETGRTRRVSWDALHAQTAAFQDLLQQAQVMPGEGVAAILPNGPEAIIAMLGSAASGAVFCSASPDFGARAVLDRFTQVAPAVLILCDGYHYAGKRVSIADKCREIVAGLPSVRLVIQVSRLQEPCEPGRVDWDASIDRAGTGTPVFQRLPFDHPLYVVFSSGTTGAPKCIVHRAGGVLLQHLKEHQLQCDLHEGDRVFYFTTCGWMMWNWLASALASGATLLLYDGSPFEPDGYRLFAFAAQERCTFFGTSARFLGAAAKAGLRPNEHFDLGSLRTLASTGSPLAPEGFDYVYQAISDNVQLASISGGTDILSCFVGPDPTAPVRRGEIQAPGLGMAVEIWDEAGQRLVGQPGELVCTRPFPSLPLGFGADPDGSRYRAAYFEHFPGVWRHGDLAEETVHGGYVIHGRSDAVLNPGGVRIGTAEIYRQVEQLDEVLEALAVGQQWQGQERVVLFVKLRADQVLDDALEDRIRAGIRAGASPRHVPALILQAPAIPRTRSGKLTELAVRELLHGRPVTNREALANPEALEFFEKVLAPAD
jgi:acetoacetyl-CoA synthetase